MSLLGLRLPDLQPPRGKRCVLRRPVRGVCTAARADGGTSWPQRCSDCGNLPSALSRGGNAPVAEEWGPRLGAPKSQYGLNLRGNLTTSLSVRFHRVKGARWDPPSPPTHLPCHPEVGETLLPALTGWLEPYASQDPVRAGTVPEPCRGSCPPHSTGLFSFHKHLFCGVSKREGGHWEAARPGKCP